MKLESITVENYRQFEKAELAFDEGITILAGANNSGKTSLINLIKNIFVDDKLNYNMSDIPAKNMREWVEWVYPIFQKFFRDGKTEENVEKDLLNVVIPKEETDPTHLMKMTTVKIHVSYNPDIDDIKLFADCIMDLDETKHDFYFMYNFEIVHTRFASSLNGDRKMFDALTYQEMLKEIKKNYEKYGITDDVVAILITRPDLATGKDILNSLEYYHFRTGHSINFYLPGYGAYWTEEEYPDGKVVTEIAGVKWSFSNQRFVEFIEDMEKYSKWRYSGESDLIFAEVKNGILSYERAIEFHLDNMLRDEAIISVNQFFEKIVRIGQEGRSMNQIGNKLGIDKGKQVVFDALLEKMPMHMGDVIKQEKYFCVKNIQK